jgi:hypothetical protein
MTRYQVRSLASVGAKATLISFADTMPKLVDGSINAVLSSGDGGIGRKLWDFPISVKLLIRFRFRWRASIERSMTA